jgi:ribosomal protein S18 acetylase RimI-like enzyme
MTVSVREIGADEIRALSRLTVDAFVGLRCAVYERGYLDELADVARRAEEALVLVAVEDDNDELLGGITYVDGSGRWSSGDLDGDAVELRMLAVAATAQGRGVAGRLVEACIARARAAGKRRILLHTTEWMEAAQRVYQRAGFRRTPENDIQLMPDLVLIGYVLDLEG